MRAQVMLCVGILTPFFIVFALSPSRAENPKIYAEVTRIIFNCIKTEGMKRGVDYDTGDSGKATIPVTAIGEIKLDFDFEEQRETLTLTITDKPLVVAKSHV